jgi:hypothetical protein
VKKTTTKWLAVFAMLVSAGSLMAHHSLGNFDTTKAVRVKGTVVQFQQINPHSFIFLEEKGADGQPRRWAVEGPSILQLTRTGLKDLLKFGEVIEICGYVPKENIVWQIASENPGASSPSGRLINAELLVTADGKQRSWGDYGVHKCFEAGYTDQHSK